MTPAIVEAAPPERRGLAWSEQEERKLYAAFVAGMDAVMCAAEHQRTAAGIYAHLREMGLIDEDNKPITPRPDYTPTPPVQKRKAKAAAALEKNAIVRKQNALTKAPEMNERFRAALDCLQNTDRSVFITGKAGAGKSTLLTYFSRNTDKNIVILAPTGVAALNVGGQTIHSFFCFSIDVTVQKIRMKKKPRNEKLYKKLQTLIIDEVSMVRADILDCVETFLRMHGPSPGTPFGGVQMVFIGDLYQLPPVVASSEAEIFRSHYETPYFFSAHAIRDFPIEILELNKIYRQKDPHFVALLNRVRNNTVDVDDIDRLNSRFNAENQQKDRFSISLTATNQRADDINRAHLAALEGRLYESSAEIDGTFGREYYPTATELSFKIGAQIMMLNNDPAGRWVNGTLGTIQDRRTNVNGKEYLRVHLHDSGETVDVGRHTWEVCRFTLAENQILSEPAGTFAQYPFRLAWAVTIHKSQGKTFENVTIDVGAGIFAAGQMYVALSRCTSFEGIVLKTMIKPQHIRTDPRIIDFMNGAQDLPAAAGPSRDERIAMIERAISDKILLNITYLKSGDTKITSIVQPLTLGHEIYQGKSFIGMRAFCTQSGENRLFSVERILDLSPSIHPAPDAERTVILRAAE